MVFVLTKSQVHASSASVRVASLRSRIELLRDLHEDERSEDWAKAAESLRGDLITPIERNGWLQGITHLYLVPHGALHYLPFAPLPSSKPGSGRYLIRDYDLAYLPSAAALLQNHRKVKSRDRLLALAPKVAHLP